MPTGRRHNFEILPALKETLRKLDKDTEKTPAMMELRKILVKRIANLEETERNGCELN